MVSNGTRTGIEELLRAARARDAEDQTDGQLLEQFLARRDETAFAVLVSRHGPMVLGVCRRILGNSDDAEDAFQAAFLVLVRKAASLTARAVLGDWLHGVARRTALNAKRVAARRRRKEEAMARPPTQREEVRDDRLPLLDEALSRLAEKYRLAIVLCDLEGWTRRQAAERLGWPEGTVAGRLARGRALLAKQLMRQGLTLSAGSLTAVISTETAPACVPASLASSTIKAAIRLAAGQAVTMGAVSAPVAALVEGVLKNMVRTKCKIAALVLLLTAVLGGGTAGVFTYLARAQEPAADPQTTDSKRDKPKKPISPKPERTAAVPEEADKVDRIRPGDFLNIRVGNSLPGNPIQNVFQVEVSGKVALGPAYGRVAVKGLTLEEAENAILKHVAKMIKEPGGVMVTRPIPADPGLERRVQQLENEVRALRELVETLRKKARD